MTASDGSGGTTVQNLSVTVIAVNDNNPVFTSSASPSVPENTTAVLTVTATDADLPVQTVTFSLTGGADQAKFAITSAGVLTFLAAPNFESPTDANGDNVYLVQVTAADGAGGTTIQNLSVTVTAANEQPNEITLAGSSIPENNAVGANVGTLSALDPDAGTTFTFSLTSGMGSTDNDDFSIVDNTLMITPASDFEAKNSYAIRVQVTDQGGLTFEQEFTIAITNVNESPTISSIAAQAIQEDTPTGSLAFTISDPESLAENLILTLTSSNTGLIPNANIVISGSGANRSLVLAPADNQSGSTTITVTVNDGTLSSNQSFQVTVQAVDDSAAIKLNSQPLVFHVSNRKVAAIDGAAAISDIDTPTLMFAGSVLQVSGQSSKDKLSILKQDGISRKGKNVLLDKTVIGTVAGGKKGAALTVHLNGAATQNSVQMALRSIGFKSVDKVVGNRTMHIQISNIGGMNTNQATRQIQVGP